MSRWPWLLGLALCGVADAIAQPRIDLAATPAWNGWTRPGRATEVDIRLSADVATRATLDVVAGRQVVRADLDLEPGRIVRLQVPIDSAEDVAVSAESPAAPPQRREVRIAQSESPLLGVGLVTGDPVHLEGFHTVTLVADDLPRNASAYSSVDALILDAPTLGALDQRQLGALLAHAAECGRIVLLNTDLRVRRVLDGMGGCGGRAVMSAASLADAREMLKSSLATSIAPAMSLVGVRELAQPGRVTWNRVLVLLAAYFAIAGLALCWSRPCPCCCWCRRSQPSPSWRCCTPLSRHRSSSSGAKASRARRSPGTRLGNGSRGSFGVTRGCRCCRNSPRRGRANRASRCVSTSMPIADV